MEVKAETIAVLHSNDTDQLDRLIASTELPFQYTDYRQWRTGRVVKLRREGNKILADVLFAEQGVDLAQADGEFSMPKSDGVFVHCLVTKNGRAIEMIRGCLAAYREFPSRVRGVRRLKPDDPEEDHEHDIGGEGKGVPEGDASGAEHLEYALANHAAMVDENGDVRDHGEPAEIFTEAAIKNGPYLNTRVIPMFAIADRVMHKETGQLMHVEEVLGDGKLRCKWTKGSGLIVRDVFASEDVEHADEQT